jgi:hypothetical protein
MIQSHPDFTRESGEGIEVDAFGPHANGKWAGWISFWRDRRPHISPLVMTNPTYDTADEARAAMVKLIEDVRKTDVLSA